MDMVNQIIVKKKKIVHIYKACIKLWIETSIGVLQKFRDKAPAKTWRPMPILGVGSRLYKCYR
jgi:hypothetical protein